MVTQIQKQKVDMTKIVRFNVYSTNTEGIVVAIDIKSKSRPGLLHYTRAIINPETRRIVKMTCTCEGFVFRGKCWHLETLKQLIVSLGLTT